eukprot:CAMPEP_0185690486 /NCGR_PEP_ID=MMETSP1164-20130828/1149_1 /TAXON_ID=1104430 /ORGANISM="Chrysoreinhardia sp, Strain CCMP2950" /LENGTH=569 /DNA_ID=CAMNT_0028357057 /DNA_START=99 /DNA_END=1808 /DNA_ORIENTATION=+
MSTCVQLVSSSYFSKIVRWLVLEVQALVKQPMQASSFRHLVVRLWDAVTVTALERSPLPSDRDLKHGSPKIDSPVLRIEAWFESILNELCKSPDSLVQVIFDLDKTARSATHFESPKLVNTSDVGEFSSTHVDNANSASTSVVSQFIRQTLLTCVTQHFDGVSRLYYSLCFYFKSIATPPELTTAQYMEACHCSNYCMRNNNTTNPTSVGMNSNLDGVAAFILPALGRYHDCDWGTFFQETGRNHDCISKWEGPLSKWEGLARESISGTEGCRSLAGHQLDHLHLLRHLCSMCKHSFQQAENGLHRYFDYAFSHPPPMLHSVQSHRNAPRGLSQYAALSLAALNSRAGNSPAADISVCEALSVAQQRCDHDCVTCILGWFRNTGSYLLRLHPALELSSVPPITSAFISSNTDCGEVNSAVPQSGDMVTCGFRSVPHQHILSLYNSRLMQPTDSHPLRADTLTHFLRMHELLSVLSRVAVCDDALRRCISRTTKQPDGLLSIAITLAEAKAVCNGQGAASFMSQKRECGDFPIPTSLTRYSWPLLSVVSEAAGAKVNLKVMPMSHWDAGK